jgi:multicomponent Na+:H+ antiporter subunit D
MLSILVLMPLFAVIILNLPVGRFMRRISFVFAAMLFLVQIAVAIFHNPVLPGINMDKLDAFFKISFSIDPLSFIAILSMGIVSLATLFVARCTIPDRDERFNFINLLMIASIGMSGIVMVKDLFSLYVFMEVVSVSSFILIAFHKDRHSLEGAFKYIMQSAIATVLMLSSVALIIIAAGDTSFDSVKTAALASRPDPVLILATGLYVCGLFIKGGLVPFHGWLPDAYSAASSSVSILLAGIVTKVCGIYTIMRVVVSAFGYNPSVNQILMFIGTVSIVVGALAALGQSNFKRMLAYSSISQIGYIIVGLGTGTALGMIGAAFHFFNHAIFKSLLFVNSAAVEEATGTVDMERLGGLSDRMPVTGTTSVVGLLSACGIPPLAGFWSKLIIIVALWQAGDVAYAAIAVLASALTLAYLLSMQRRVFFGKLAQGLEEIRESCPTVQTAAIALALITLGVGIFFPFMFNNLISPVKDIFLK